MTLKLRILTQDNQHVSATNSAEELLKVLLDIQTGALMLSQEEEDSLRGWLLLHAEELNNAETKCLEGQPNLCIGKTKEGRPFVRDARGDWPPIKPEF